MLKRINFFSLLILLAMAFFIGIPKVEAASCSYNLTGTNWFSASAWSCGVVPSAYDRVTIDGISVFILMGQPVVVRRANTSLLNGGVLDQISTFYNYGTLTQDNGSFLYNEGTFYNFGTMNLMGIRAENQGTIVNCGTIIGIINLNQPLPCGPIPPPPDADTGGNPCINDGRLNSLCTDSWATVALYCQANGDLHVYSIDSASHGTFSFSMSLEDIESAGILADGEVGRLIAASEDLTIRIYRLSDSSFQVNAPYVDGVHGYLADGYIFQWQDACPQETETTQKS